MLHIIRIDDTTLLAVCEKFEFNRLFLNRFLTLMALNMFKKRKEKVTNKLGYNKFGYSKLGYYKLGYN